MALKLSTLNVTESIWLFVKKKKKKKKKSIPSTALIDNSHFNKAHIINTQTYKPTNQTNKQQKQQQRSPDKANSNYSRKKN